MRLIDPAGAAPVPWRNGSGTTRELAQGSDAAGELLWRVSVADLERDASFSVFPGLDRTFIPLDSARLCIDGVSTDVPAGGQIRFPGEALTSVQVARPTQALNVMVRRGACSATVLLHSAESSALPGAELTIVLGALAADVHLTHSLTKEPHG